MRSPLRITGAVLALTFTHSVYATVTLNLAVAANMADCVGAIDAAFIEGKLDTQVKVSIGASGNFYAQIKNGAPFDVFMSADMDYARKLVAEQHAVAATFKPYAYGRLALWTLRDDLDLSNYALLATPAVTRISIANPDIAPYGQAARAVLQSANLWDVVQSKLVRGENIAQALQFVQTGNADVGFVPVSLLQSPAINGLGHVYLPPLESYPAIEQGIVVTEHGSGNPLASDYVKFIGGERARTLLRACGYALPKS